MSGNTARTAASFSLLAGLGPMVAVVFSGFLAVAAPLAALSLYLRDHLGFGPLTIGCVIGLQSLATVSTRHRAGTACDQRGPRAAVLLGLPVVAGSGVLYALAALLPIGPDAALGVVVLGRLVAGWGESLFVTGTMSWGIARVGAARTGTVMSWQGIALYGALGVGAPLGLLVQSRAGFAAVGVVAVVAPLLAWGVAWRLTAAPAAGGERVAFHRVLGLIWRPGLVLGLATVPFAAMAAFLALDYAAQGWTQTGLALFSFGAAFVLVRLAAGGLPDRLGPTRVAVGSLLIEAVGQAVLWRATAADMALVGATLTGLGFSLMFPAMGVLATRSVPPEQRGRGVGNFIAFFDLAIGVTGPAVGLATQQFGIASAFLIGSVATAAALFLLPSIQRLQRRRAD